MQLPTDIREIDTTCALLSVSGDPVALTLAVRYSPRAMARRAYQFAKATPSTFRDTFRWHLARQLQQFRLEVETFCVVNLEKVKKNA